MSEREEKEEERGSRAPVAFNGTVARFFLGLGEGMR